MEFVKTVRSSGAYKFIANALYNFRTMTRRTIWGDRLFLQFKGPATILMSSRGVRVADVLSGDQVNEIADTPAGVLPAAVELASKTKGGEQSLENSKGDVTSSSLNVGTTQKDGKVSFEDGKDLKEFVR